MAKSNLGMYQSNIKDQSCLPKRSNLMSLAACIPSSFKFFSICLLLALEALSSADIAHPMMKFGVHAVKAEELLEAPQMGINNWKDWVDFNNLLLELVLFLTWLDCRPYAYSLLLPISSLILLLSLIRLSPAASWGRVGMGPGPLQHHWALMNPLGGQNI